MDTLNWSAPEIDEVPVGDFAFRHPAILQLIRCALPSWLARRSGLPSRIWVARHAGGGRALLRWGGADGLLAWGCVVWSDASGLWFCEVDADHQAEHEDIAGLLGAPADEIASAQVRWVGPVQRISPASVEPAQPPSPPPSPDHEAIDAIGYRDRWHADLLDGAQDPTTGASLERTDQAPLRDFVGWRDGSNRRELRVGDALRAQIAECLNRKVSNFRLLDDDALQVVYATPLPMYPGVDLIEIIDRRDLRARHGSFFFHAGRGLIFPLNGKSDGIHALNEIYGPKEAAHGEGETPLPEDAQAGHWAAWFSDENKVAIYLDLFLRYVYDVNSDAFFELIVDWNRDLPVNWNRSVDEHTRNLGTAFSKQPHEIGLWRIEAARVEGGEHKQEEAKESHVRYFSALILYGRNLWLVVFKICLKEGLPQVEMVADSICKGGENLQVMPRIHNPDSVFSLVIQPPNLPVSRDHEDALLPADSVLFEQRSRPVSGQIDGPTFRGLFENGQHWRLPRGESWGHRSAQRQFDLEVADAVSLYGRRDLEGARLAIGVHFRGRVDLRSIKLGGSLTFAHCKFDELVLMDDAEIDGSVSFQGSEFLGGLSLKGAVIRGAMDLTSAFYAHGVGGGMDLSGVSVDGDIDLCGVGELRIANLANRLLSAGMRLERARIGGNLRLGNGPGGFREPMLIPFIDGSQADITGSLLVLGACSMRTEKQHRLESGMLLFPGARIGGHVDIRPHPGGADLLPFERDLLQSEALNEQLSQPRLRELVLDNAHIAGNVHVTGCVIGDGFSLLNARIEGRVWIQSQVTRSRIGEQQGVGAVRHWPVSIERFVMRGARVDGMITFEGVNFHGGIEMYEMTVGGMICMRSAYIQQGLTFKDGFDALRDEAGVARRSDHLRTRIWGDLGLSVMRCDSVIHLLGCIVDGSLHLLNASIGGLTVEPDVVPQGPDQGENGLTRWEIVPPQVGGVLIHNCEIRGRCSFGLIQVLGRDLGRGKRGLFLDNSVVHDDLMFWRAGQIEDLIGDRLGGSVDGEGMRELTLAIAAWSISVAVLGRVSLRRCELRGDCNLSLAKVDGVIDLSDTKARGDVRIESHEAGMLPAVDPQVDGGDRLRQWHRSAITREVDLSMIECENDLLLSGLCINAGPDGQVQGRHAKVKGRTVLASTDRAGWLDVGGGCIVFVDADLSRLSLTDDVFRQEGTRLDLDRVTMHTFDFTFSKAAMGMRFERKADSVPCIIMHNADIRGWNVQDESSVKRGYDVAHFERLLCSSGPQQESVWARVESYLRAQGLDDEANDIYRAMKLNVRKAHKPIRSWLSELARGALLAGALQGLLVIGVLASEAGVWGWFALLMLVLALGVLPRVRDFLQRDVIGYGTTVMPIAWAWLMMLVMSMPIYVVADNFELSNPARAAGKTASDLGLPHQEVKLADKEWSIGHAGAMALRYHVPIISLGVEDDWEPRDVQADGGFLLRMRLPWFGGWPPQPVLTWSTQEIKGLSPHAYAAYMQILNWMAWPVFLTYMALKLWRDGKA